MCECGCTTGNKTFKMKAPDGWYVVELLAGCSYCSVSPGLQIHHPPAVEYLDDVEHMPDLPVIGDGEHSIAMIKCGLDPDEAKDAAVKCFTGAETENDRVDDVLAEIFGEDLWKEALASSPSVILPKG